MAGMKDQNLNKVSIQLPLGGHSFSLDNLPADDVANVEVVVDTHKVVLAPREEVSLDTATELLHIVGRGCSRLEHSVCSELQADIVAVMAIDAEALTAIVERYGSRASFTSPLLDMRHSAERCLTLDVSEKVCYMRLFENGLQRAEAYEATSASDILYYLNSWIGRSDIKIYVKGNRDTVKLLKKYYKHVVCE